MPALTRNHQADSRGGRTHVICAACNPSWARAVSTSCVGEHRRRGLLLARFVRAAPAGFACGFRAQAVELVAMTEHGEAAEPLGDPILQRLDLVVLELEDQAAFDADQVIVVIA